MRNGAGEYKSRAGAVKYILGSRSAAIVRTGGRETQIPFHGSFISVSLYVSCPAGNYMFKFNKRDTRTSFEICSKLTMKISE